MVRGIEDGRVMGRGEEQRVWSKGSWPWMQVL